MIGNYGHEPHAEDDGSEPAGETPAKPKPVADCYALIERGDQPTLWLNLGPVWLNKDGSLAITTDVEPLAWQAARPRKMQIRFREPETE